MNKVILQGYVGKNPEIVTIDGKKIAANATIATSEHWKDKTTGEKKSESTWHNLVFIGAHIETAEKYIKTGDRLLVEGRIRNRQWDKPDGTKGYRTDIVVQSFEMLSSKKEEHPQQQGYIPEKTSNNTYSGSTVIYPSKSTKNNEPPAYDPQMRYTPPEEEEKEYNDLPF